MPVHYPHVVTAPLCHCTQGISFHHSLPLNLDLSISSHLCSFTPLYPPNLPLPLYPSKPLSTSPPPRIFLPLHISFCLYTITIYVSFSTHISNPAPLLLLIHLSTPLGTYRYLFTHIFTSLTVHVSFSTSLPFHLYTSLPTSPSLHSAVILKLGPPPLCQ